MFRKYFPAFAVPQLLMLFYAIYLRIDQYDLTMNRYFVVIFGVWLLGISLYYTLSKQKYLGFIPFSIGIIILLISVGPWSVYSLPAARQYDRLITNLEKAHILTNGAIVPLAKFSDIDSNLSGDIYDGINYMCDFSECKKIKTLFAKELVEKEKTSRADFEKIGGILPMGLGSNYGKQDSVYRGLTKWEVVQTVTDTIKVRNARFMDSVAQKYLSFHTNYDEGFFPLRLEGYEYLVNIYGNSSTDRLSHEKEEFWISIDSDAGNLTIHKKNIIFETISLAQILSDI